MIDLSKTVKKTDNEYFPPLKEPAIFSYLDADWTADQKVSYKDAMVESMTELGKLGAIFIGYNVKYGNAIGTLKDVPDDQKLETPVAENLMAGLAIMNDMTLC